MLSCVFWVVVFWGFLLYSIMTTWVSGCSGYTEDEGISCSNFFASFSVESSSRSYGRVIEKTREHTGVGDSNFCIF